MQTPPSKNHDLSNVAVVVAALNEETVIASVVSKLRKYVSHVIVVDDGSSDETARRASEAGAVVLRHCINRGQGASLQTGISYALGLDVQAIVTFDADGQHRAEELDLICTPVLEGTADIALGSRFLVSTQNIPFRRRWLLRLARIFTYITSGLRLSDTHNGYRAFSKSAASCMQIRLDRMAHASEILDHIRRHRLRYVEVPVHIDYTEYSRAKGQRGVAALRIAMDYLVEKFFP